MFHAHAAPHVADRQLRATDFTGQEERSVRCLLNEVTMC